MDSNDENKIAVSLKYDQESDAAPIISAKGKGLLAEQILTIARENGISIKKDKELVEILSLLDVDSPIPLESYTAVAAILSYIYEMNNKMKKEAEE